MSLNGGYAMIKYNSTQEELNKKVNENVERKCIL